ncbi:SprT-like domain-containing protein [Algoriphagus confluentis]|uniref:SprT-like domain-containing protein n=1 Tax=Algoriphagus confluentis TaxID=1697556 RepID=A0ABQ6PKF3_9BACT|nr:SprT-like domain-containing protein [Algoriphagus confluentis]
MKVPPALISIFTKHLPPTSISYCALLWEEIPFHFHVKAPRTSKLGDFRYRKDQKIQTITLNSDLNPYQFLLTFIHEVAHLRTFERYGPVHAPHGKEWKKEFRQLLAPILVDSVFPKDILVPLRLHMQNPSASSARDLFLMKEMSKYDKKIMDSEETFLADLPAGQSFILQGRTFTKKETRRTRVMCEEVSTGKKFLVSRLAKVIPA